MVVMVDDNNKFKNKLRFRKRPARLSTQNVIEENSSDNNKEVVVDDKNNRIVDAIVESEMKSEKSEVEKPPRQPPMKYRFDDIIKSQQDAKNYRGLILKENGMRVMLVSDPVSEKSAVCLSVEVGHMQDPHDIPG